VHFYRDKEKSNIQWKISLKILEFCDLGKYNCIGRIPYELMQWFCWQYRVPGKKLFTVIIWMTSCNSLFFLLYIMLFWFLMLLHMIILVFRMVTYFKVFRSTIMIQGLWLLYLKHIWASIASFKSRKIITYPLRIFLKHFIPSCFLLFLSGTHWSHTLHDLEY
jgi:hypothetical protein